jgi:hypothetical protein
MKADWRRDLKGFFEKTEKSKQEEKGTEFSRFIAGVVVPAFEQIKEEMARHGREASIRDSGTSAQITVSLNGEEEIMYRVQGRTFPDRILPFAEIRYRERKGLKRITVESMFRSGPPTSYRLSDISADEISRNFVINYVNRVRTG